MPTTRSVWPSRQQRLMLYVGVGLALLVVVVVALVAIVHFRQEVDSKLTDESKDRAAALQMTIGGLVEQANLVLLAGADEISQQMASEHVDRASITQYLVLQQERVPLIAFLRATNERGDVIYGPRLKSPPVNVSDRDYFIRLRDHPDAGLVIGKPLISRTDNAWFWGFSQRVNKPDGSFGGVVFAAIPVGRLDELLAQIRMGADDTIALRDADLALIARFPAASTTNVPIGDATNFSPGFKEALTANPDRGTYLDGPAPIDGIRRVTSYVRDPKFRFIVSASFGREAALAEWHEQAGVIAALATGLVLALLAFAWSIDRYWRRLGQGMAALEDSHRALEETQDIVSLGRWTFDARTSRWTSSDVVDRIHGIDASYPRDAAGAQALLAPEDREAMQDYLFSLIEQGRPFDREYRIVRQSDGKERWVHGKGKWQRDADGKPTVLVCTVQDITERKVAEVRTSFLANHDRLTGLPNRALFFDRFSQALSRARRDGKHVALLFIDIDDFKHVNDVYGHAAGDVALKAVAGRLLSCARAVDTVARIGGDEFALILGDLHSPADAAHLSARLLDATAPAIVLPVHRECRVGVSIGISIFPDHGTDMDGLLAAADAAMYRSKQAGRRKITCWDESIPFSWPSNEDWIRIDDAHSTGVAEIDHQHHELARLISGINNAIREEADEARLGGLFTDLAAYARFHFDTEHALMERGGYPDRSAHDSVHERLLSDVLRFKEHYTEGTELLLLERLKDWLLLDIVGEDMRLGKFLLEQAGSARHDRPSDGIRSDTAGADQVASAAADSLRSRKG